MKKLFAPWLAGDTFEDDDAFFAYLVRYDKICNAVRVVLFAVAALALLIGYAASDSVAYVHPWYTIAVAAMALALGVSLLIAQNEKCLPPELRQK